MPYTNPDSPSRLEAVRMYVAGATLAQIHEQTGIHTNSLYRDLVARGYMVVYDPARRSTIGVHVLVMESIIGRRLVRGENVHHKNTIRDDNRPENLELWFKMQPAGGRVADLIAYVCANHPEAVRAEMNRFDQPSSDVA